LFLPCRSQAVAALSIALVSMGEELGADMSIRQFDHMLQVMYVVAVLTRLPRPAAQTPTGVLCGCW
jgi:hypothetical protein